jgi:hypothetical protein
MEKTKRDFKPINVSVRDWDEYNRAAIQLSALRGKRVSIPALLNEAYGQYMDKLINSVDNVNK